MFAKYMYLWINNKYYWALDNSFDTYVLIELHGSILRYQAFVQHLEHNIRWIQWQCTNWPGYNYKQQKCSFVKRWKVCVFLLLCFHSFIPVFFFIFIRHFFCTLQSPSRDIFGFTYLRMCVCVCMCVCMCVCVCVCVCVYFYKLKLYILFLWTHLFNYTFFFFSSSSFLSLTLTIPLSFTLSLSLSLSLSFSLSLSLSLISLFQLFILFRNPPLT